MMLVVYCLRPKHAQLSQIPYPGARCDNVCLLPKPVPGGMDGLMKQPTGSQVEYTRMVADLDSVQESR